MKITEKVSNNKSSCIFQKLTVTHEGYPETAVEEAKSDCSSQSSASGIVTDVTDTGSSTQTHALTVTHACAL